MYYEIVKLLCIVKKVVDMDEYYSGKYVVEVFYGKNV